jgi:uncharacterized membrane protein YkoI
MSASCQVAYAMLVFAEMTMTLSLQTGIRAVALAAAMLIASGIGGVDARDHDAARRAVEAGEIRPLTDLLKDVRGKLPGEVIGVKIEQKSGRWFYEFRAVDKKGRLFEIYVDARTGEIERVKEK